MPRDRAAGSSALASRGPVRACATRHAGLRTRLLRDEAPPRRSARCHRGHRSRTPSTPRPQRASFSLVSRRDSPRRCARGCINTAAPDHAAPIHACLGTSPPRSRARPPWAAGKCRGPRGRRHPARHTPRSVLTFKSLPQWSTWRQARPAKRYKFFAEMELSAGPSRRKSERCGPPFTVFQHRSDFEFASVSRGEGSAPWAEARPAAVPW